VLAAEVAERFAFYGLLCNMALFLNSDPLLWASYNAINAILIFTGVSYFMTLLGGWLADSCLGKYKTVILFFLFYVGGYSMWPSLHNSKLNSDCKSRSEAPSWCSSIAHNGSYDNSTIYDISYDRVSLSEERCSWAVFLSLTIIAIGYGGVRVNIVPFGALQVEDQGSHSLRVYFNWLYWCINVGSFLAYLVLGYVQQNISYFYGYLVPLCSLLLAWIIFASGGLFLYVRKKEAGSSPLTDVIKVLISSIKYSCRKAHVLENEEFVSNFFYPSSSSTSCLDRASFSNGGDRPEQHVHDTKMFCKILVVLLSMIPYWTIYYQMQTTFFVQGLHMKLDFNATNMTLPATWLSLFNIVFIILLVPLLDRVIYPFFDSRQISPTLRLRILTGMFFSMIAMIVAGIVERIRLEIYWGSDNIGYPHIQIIACTTYYAANMSIFWQVPQYLLLALSEVFSSIAGLEMSYIYAPRSIQSMIMGMFYWSQGIGAILGFVVVMATEGSWFPSLDDHPDKMENNCHLDYYFFTLAGIQVVGALLFCLVSWSMD
ncbi:hypothetical protein HELRODRAFT_149824, partial [Helobdella robusta]|uniref:Major facilitator superfamily (MFS) profile domain-containing protein n=1 Tax=Helobdella robusta TaxID=6412 RepID=T1EKD7_HELRO